MNDPVPVTIVGGKQRQAPKSANADSFQLVSDFLGYRNKEDKTNLPPGYLIEGSYNVLNTTGGRIGIRKGYTLDGQADSTLAGIDSAFDYEMDKGYVRNLRAGNGKIQMRYVSTSGIDHWKTNILDLDEVYWIDLDTDLYSTAINWTDWWDTTELQTRVLYVDGSGYIKEWSGGVTTLASVSGGVDIVKTGIKTFAEEGFASGGYIVIDGSPYLYTGGYDTDTLYGIDPTPNGLTAGAVIVQKPKTTTTASMTAMPLEKIDLISALNGQCYLGDFNNNSVYISKISVSGGISVSSYTDYSFTNPGRLIGEGALLTLDSQPVGFVPQEDAMYITAGKSQWYQTNFLTSSDNTKENVNVKRLKTAINGGAISQSAIGKIKNSVVFISNEPTLDELGRVEQILGTPQSTNMSDPIKIDFDNYNFTNSQVFYFKYFIYISVPTEGLVRIFNLAKGFWEAPQYLPVGRFAIIDNQLYGHSYTTLETYKLFDGYVDNENVIKANAVMNFQNYGMRMKTKYFNEFAVEGYINENSIITLGIKYDIDGCATDTSYDIKGTDTQIVCTVPSTASLGKETFGKHPFGADLNQTTLDQLPPKFRVIKTFPRLDFYEAQYSFTSLGKNQRWEILAFGPKVERTMYGENDIKQ